MNSLIYSIFVFFGISVLLCSFKVLILKKACKDFSLNKQIPNYIFYVMTEDTPFFEMPVKKITNFLVKAISPLTCVRSIVESVSVIFHAMRKTTKAPNIIFF